MTEALIADLDRLLCLDLMAETGGQPGQLLTFRHDWEKRSIDFPSLETWLAQIVSPTASTPEALSAYLQQRFGEKE